VVPEHVADTVMAYGVTAAEITVGVVVSEAPPYRARDAFLAESGIKDTADVQAAVTMGASAVLVGEALMRADDKQKKLAAFYAAADRVKESLQ
jgi:indole-3-glycerol phosphate synthase